MEKHPKIVIVGAGLAGLTAAMHLSKLGYPVVVIEKNSFPKHKVCGEYISNEVLPYLNWLGIDIEKLRPAHIDSMVFSTVNGQTLEAKLPLGGFGLSRYALDFHCYEKALAQKCEFIHETVDAIQFADEQFTIHLSNDTLLTADIVLGAFGKRSNLDQQLARDFIQKKASWLAVKGHYKANFPDHLVGLHNFKGGYCGISKVEGGLVNICYLADYETFKRYKNIANYQAEVVCQNPQLQLVFQNATLVFEKQLTISQISFEKKLPVENHLLMIGDSAGLIHPLCGNGMAMAIHSAKIASELVDNYFLGSKTRKELEIEYAITWNRNFKSRLRYGRMLGSLLRQQHLSRHLLRIFIKCPALLAGIIKRTHGKSIALT